MEFPHSDRWHEINEMLREVQALPDSERETFLMEACGNDDALRREVQTLLDAASAYGEVFEQGAVALATSFFDEGQGAVTEARPLDPGQRVGPYRLLERIGDGGTSRVYRAERVDNQFQRTVAIKVLRFPLEAEEEGAERFRAEQQILASLSHPNIADVYDGGMLEDGRPYIVMEYVDGRPITGYCRAEKCSVDQVLALFRQAAAAVQAAHEQLVVHRDLKPSNVLVDRATGTVELLDFGIAKILGELPGAPAPSTQTGRYPMTPTYAAPEQVKGHAISVATDTYALGVVLYELLTGRRPYGTEETSPYAVARAVCEERPPRPSAVIEDESRRALLEGDLDAIVMKALRKDPDDRYNTVEAMVDDLDRYQTNRPVRAKKGTWVYRGRKFVRRNRRALAGLLLAIVALAGFAIYHVQRLSIERNQAQVEAQRAEEVSHFLVDLFEATDPENAQGDVVTASSLLRRGSDRVSELKEQPQVQANLLHTLGRAHRRLGHPDEAASLIQQSVETYRSLEAADAADHADAVSELGLYRRDQGDYEGADSLLEEAIQIRRALDTPEQLADDLMRQAYVKRRLENYEAARAAIEEALEIQTRRSGDERMGTAESYFNLAAIYRELGQYRDAEKYQRKSLSIVEDQVEGPHPGLSANYSNLGLLLKEGGNLESAERYYRKSLKVDRTLYEAPHRSIATKLQNLGSLHTELNRYDEAASVLHDALEMRRSLYGDEHPSIAAALHSLGVLYARRGQTSRADSLLAEALEMKRAIHGKNEPGVALTLKQIAFLREAEGRVEDAEARYQQALSIYEETRPEDHPALAQVRSAYGQFLVERGRIETAESLLRPASRALSDTPMKPRATVRASVRLGTCLTRLGHYAAADSVLKRGLTLADSLGAGEVHEKGRHALEALHDTWADSPSRPEVAAKGKGDGGE